MTPQDGEKISADGYILPPGTSSGQRPTRSLQHLKAEAAFVVPSPAQTAHDRSVSAAAEALEITIRAGLQEATAA